MFQGQKSTLSNVTFVEEQIVEVFNVWRQSGGNEGSIQKLHDAMRTDAELKTYNLQAHLMKIEVMT